MLRKKLKDANKALEALDFEALEKREAEIEKAIDEVTTDEEREAVEAEIEAHEAEKTRLTEEKEGREAKIREIENNKDATAVEQNLMTTLEVCYEFYLRGFHFDTIDIYRSDATKFLVTENGLLPPFISVHGLGESAAIETVEKRKGKSFISVEEFSLCCNKLSKTHIEQLKALGAFAGMAETSQITLF